MSRLRRWRKRRAWRKLRARNWSGPPYTRPPADGGDFLTIYIPMGDTLRQAAPTLEERARIIEYAQTAANVVISQEVRWMFPIKWDAERLKRVAERTTAQASPLD